MKHEIKNAATHVAANRQMPELSISEINNEQKEETMNETEGARIMFASKEACVREIVGRVLDSCLEDEEALTAAFKLIEAYREKPCAFNDNLTMVEPLNIEAAVQKSTDPEEKGYWQKVNDAVVGVYHVLTEGCTLRVKKNEAGNASDELPTTYYDAIGPMVEGWGLFDKETGLTLPVFCESRQEARARKDDDNKVVRVAMFTVAGE